MNKFALVAAIMGLGLSAPINDKADIVEDVLNSVAINDELEAPTTANFLGLGERRMGSSRQTKYTFRGELSADQCFRACGDRVAIPRNDEDTRAIKNLLPRPTRVWVGITKPRGQRFWNVGNTGTRFNGPFRWGPNEGSQNEPRAAAIFNSARFREGKWYDMPNDGRRHFCVCEDAVQPARRARIGEACGLTTVFRGDIASFDLVLCEAGLNCESGVCRRPRRPSSIGITAALAPVAQGSALLGAAAQSAGAIAAVAQGAALQGATAQGAGVSSVVDAGIVAGALGAALQASG